MKSALRYVVLVALALGSLGSARAQVSMQLVADNDFALFVGDSTGVIRLIYQNDVAWPDQLNNLASFTFNLQSGETTFYLLAMGGGGIENISGLVNGVDLPTISVTQSSDLASFLTGYFNNGTPDMASAGTYNASLADVQAAFPSLTWGATTPTDGNDGVANQSPTGHGFHFDDSTAVFYRFSAADVNVAAVPEPSSYLLLMVAGAAVVLSRRVAKPRG